MAALRSAAVDALVAFAATLLSLRLAGLLVRHWRERRRPELAAWAASLASYALASGALAWSAAAGWSNASFRVYYLFGALLTAALLGAGSLLLVGRRAAAPIALVYVGLAAGAALAAPLDPAVGGSEIPDAREHLDLLPVRALAIAGNVAGSVAVVVVALVTIRRRPLGNALIVAGVGVAAAGSALFGLGEGEAAASVAVAALLLYGGFVVPSRARAPGNHPDPQEDGQEEHERLLHGAHPGVREESV